MLIDLQLYFAYSHCILHHFVRTSASMKHFEVILFLIISNFTICYGSISATKCQEYGKAVYVQSQSPTLMRTSKQNSVSECGIVSVPLIVGGSRASEMEFPHMAVIGFGADQNSELRWDCGASLISELFLLTAAHCLENREASVSFPFAVLLKSRCKNLTNRGTRSIPFGEFCTLLKFSHTFPGPAQMIRLGTVHLEPLDADIQVRRVVQRIRHPNYNPPRKANDIGLIKMDSPVEFTPYVRPACLNTDAPASAGSQGIASGFGKLSYDAEQGSKNLMKVLLNVYSSEQCTKALAHKEPIVDSMLCAGLLAGGKDTCQGDSGGPFQTVLQEPYCMYSLIGVTSFGKFCGFANSPAVYTKISSFIPWIESNVWQ